MEKKKVCFNKIFKIADELKGKKHKGKKIQKVYYDGEVFILTLNGEGNGRVTEQEAIALK
jgi:hypothetical protein